MLKALVDHNNYRAIFELPCSYEEIEEHYMMMGHYDCDNDLDAISKVKLIAETPIDNHLQLLFAEDAKLPTINLVCDLFYNLPIEQQIDLTDKMADGRINDERDLLELIKEIKAAEPKNSPTIVFSRVKLWSQSGEEAEFFMGGIPDGYDDMEDHEECIDFKEFLEQNPDAVIEGITAHVTSFSEGNGEARPASKEDIERIYTAVAEVDLDTITGWEKIGESTFFFDYEYDEQPGMTEIE